MKNREAKSAVLFRHWLRANPQISGSYEIKDTRGKNYINFNEVTEQQLNYGLAIRGNKGTLIRVQGVNGEPDYIYLRNAPSWIVIRYPKSFEVISVEAFIQEKEKSKKKSLLLSRAKDISVISVKLLPR